MFSELNNEGDMKLSDFNKLMAPPTTADPAGGFEPHKKEIAGVECDICETEMEIVNSFHTGGVPVRCPSCGHRGTRFV